MNVFAQKLDLFVKDLVRRTSLKVAAGILILIGSGFLLAALWSFLADQLDWGSMFASLAIGGVFSVIGLIIIATTGSARHRPPTSDELRADLQERVSVATGAVMDRVTTGAEEAIDRVQVKAGLLADAAGNRVQKLVDTVSYGADRFVGGTEARVVGLARRASDEVSQKLGISDDQKEHMAQGIEKAKSSNLAAIAPVIGAFAVGLTLAQKFASRRRDHDDDDLYEEDWDDNWDDDDWDDDRRY